MAGRKTEPWDSFVTNSQNKIKMYQKLIDNPKAMLKEAKEGNLEEFYKETIE